MKKMNYFYENGKVVFLLSVKTKDGEDLQVVFSEHLSNNGKIRLQTVTSLARAKSMLLFFSGKEKEEMKKIIGRTNNIFLPAETDDKGTPKETFPPELISARTCAEKGDVTIMMVYIGIIERSALKIRADVSEEISKIEAIGYKNALPIELINARTYAEKGNITIMRFCIDIVERCALRLGVDISAEIAEIKAIGYKNAISNGLTDALKYAEKRDYFMMRVCIDIVKQHALKLGVDVSGKIAEIEGY